MKISKNWKILNKIFKYWIFSIYWKYWSPNFQILKNTEDFQYTEEYGHAANYKGRPLEILYRPIESLGWPIL